MKITLKRLNENYHFEAKNERGNLVHIDTSKANGGDDLGASPMELLLMGVAGCSAIDIISILKKQRQNITYYGAEVIGERVQVDEYKPFKNIEVKIILEGEIDPQKALRAAELSFEKYCSVSKTFEATATINYKVQLNNTIL